MSDEVTPIFDFMDDDDGDLLDLSALSEPLTLPEESTLTLLRLSRSERRCRALADSRGFTREEFALAWSHQLSLSMIEDTRTMARFLSAHMLKAAPGVLTLNNN